MKSVFIAIGLILSIGTLSPSHATSFSVAGDYSPSSGNPNNVWSYGYLSTLDGNFIAFNQHNNNMSGSGFDGWYSSSQGFWHLSAFYNPSGSTKRYTTLQLEAGEFALHPGPLGQYAVARWTAPEDMTIMIDALYKPGDDGNNGDDPSNGYTTTSVHILHEGAEQFLDTVWGDNLDPIYATAFSSILSVFQGDTIDFAVGNGNDGFVNDTTILSVEISTNPVPEPTTMLLLGTGLVGVAGAARRKKKNQA